MRVPLIAAAIEAGVTAGVLLVAPAFFSWIVFGKTLSVGGEALGRLAGIVLMTLAAWCYVSATGVSEDSRVTRLLLAYNGVAAIYLAYLGAGLHLTGLLLWPAVAVHVILAVLFLRARELK